MIAINLQKIINEKIVCDIELITGYIHRESSIWGVNSKNGLTSLLIRSPYSCVTELSLGSVKKILVRLNDVKCLN